MGKEDNRRQLKIKEQLATGFIVRRDQTVFGLMQSQYSSTVQIYVLSPLFKKLFSNHLQTKITLIIPSAVSVITGEGFVNLTLILKLGNQNMHFCSLKSLRSEYKENIVSISPNSVLYNLLEVSVL